MIELLAGLDIGQLIQDYGIFTVSFIALVFLIAMQYRKDRQVENERQLLESRADSGIINSQADLTRTVGQLSLQMNEQLIKQQEINATLIETQGKLREQVRTITDERDKLQDKLNESIANHLKAIDDLKTTHAAEIKELKDKITTLQQELFKLQGKTDTNTGTAKNEETA
jgi:polyhydroxyalkanoate synthesis regulator phasin